MSRPRTISDEEILNSVRDCALRFGAQVTLDDVAKQLKVSPPALLKRFGSRQRLMVEALRPPSPPPFVALLQRGVSRDAPLIDQLRGLFGAIASSFTTVFPCMMVLRESGIPPEEIWTDGKPPTPKLAYSALTEWLRSAKRCGLVHVEELDAASSAMLGAVTSRIAIGHMMHQPMAPREVRAFVEELSSFFSRALTASHQAKPKRAVRAKKERQP